MVKLFIFRHFVQIPLQKFDYMLYCKYNTHHKSKRRDKACLV